MPVTQTWTALPSGRSKDNLVVSALVTLRLTTGDGADALLSAFPDVAHWAQRMAHASFAVEIDGVSHPAKITSAPSQHVWKALFPPNHTLVRSHAPEDFSTNPVNSFSVLNTQRLLKAFHVAAGQASPGALPQWFGDIPDGAHRELLDTFALNRDEARQLADSYRRQGRDVPPRIHIARLVAFYARQTDASQKATALPTAKQLRAKFDFHAIVSSLGDHPALLRPTALVIDLQLPAAAVAPSPNPRTVRVRPSWTPESADVHPPGCPATAAIWDGTDFAAVSQRGEIDRGYLVLEAAAASTPRYSLVDVDVDGGVLKAVHFASDIQQLAGQENSSTPNEAGLPSLRSAGLSLIRDGRGDELAQSLKTNADTDPVLQADPEQVTLSAEQLVRGYRLDIREHEGGAWRSLCERSISYHFVADPSLDSHYQHLSDEGFVQLAVTSDQKAPDKKAIEAKDQFYLHESLARWEGWSLVAPRPGLAVSHSEDPASPPETGDPASGTSAGLETSVAAAPKSLPRLRIGHRYWIRARVVDLAGNSPKRTDPADDHAIPADTEGTVYRRYEPVAAPLVVLQESLGAGHPGESLERLVIRTFNASTALDGEAAAAPAARHIAPPRSSVALAEACGALDAPDGRPRANLYPMLVERDAAQLPVDGASTPAVPIETADSFELPYLPDPLARGAAFRDLPASTSPTRTIIDGSGPTTSTLPGAAPRSGSATLVRYEDSAGWPEITPFRVVLREGENPPHWHETKRVLEVFLPKAAVASTQLSSYIDLTDLASMGVWEWLRESVEPGPNIGTRDVDGQARLDAFIGVAAELAAEGGLWQLTPHRTLILVHAVQQPLGQPTITTLTATRQPGGSSAYLIGAIKTHGRSTAKISLQADWTDPVDDPNLTTLGKSVGSAKAVELSIDELTASVVLNGSTVVGSYDPDTDTLTLGWGELPYAPQHEFHDTRHHLVTYTPVSASRFREYFEPTVPGGTSRKGNGMTVHVPSSRRPDAPTVRYVIPAFGWQRDEDTNLRTSRRLGGTIRVFLDRPWWSSGDGELLGIVTWPGVIPAERQAQLSKFVSRIGGDPIYLSSSPAPALLGPYTFPSATAQEYGLTLDELPDDTVDVAGHTPTFDENRGLWTCDVRIDAGDVYHPWVRLALARYQPHALPEAKLSRVMLADFAALPMNRSVLLTYDPFDPDNVAVTVSGPSYEATANDEGSPSPGGSFVQVSIERRIANIADPVLGWEPAPVPVVADADVRIDQLLWHGHISLPTARKAGDYRVVVREYETLLADRTVLPRRRKITGPVLTERLVYADTLLI